MWNNDKEEKRKVVKPLPQEPKPQVRLTQNDLMSDYEAFKFSFLNSTEIRHAHGFEIKDKKLIQVDKKWINETSDKQKVNWIREIFKEVNGIK